MEVCQTSYVLKVNEVFNVVNQSITNKTTLKYYTSIIKDKNISSSIINTINKQGDRQNLSTNVRAQMTEWRMQYEPGFSDLNNIILNMLKMITRTHFNIDINYICSDMWGMKYVSNNMAITHDHFPATWSISYYLNPPKDCPGLTFTEYKKEVNVEDGLLIIFPGNIKHHVESKKFKGARYVVSANYNPNNSIAKS